MIELKRNFIDPILSNLPLPEMYFLDTMPARLIACTNFFLLSKNCNHEKRIETKELYTLHWELTHLTA